MICMMKISCLSCFNSMYWIYKYAWMYKIKGIIVILTKKMTWKIAQWILVQSKPNHLLKKRAQFRVNLGSIWYNVIEGYRNRIEDENHISACSCLVCQILFPCGIKFHKKCMIELIFTIWLMEFWIPWKWDLWHYFLSF